MSLRLDSRTLNMKDSNTTAQEYIAIASKFHDQKDGCQWEVDNLRRLGKLMKEQDFPIRTQIEKEKLMLTRRGATKPSL